MSISSTLPSVQPVHGEWAQRINAATRDLIYRLSLTPQALQRQQVFAIARSKNPYSKSDSISYMVCDLPPGGRDRNIFSVEYVFFACDR